MGIGGIFMGFAVSRGPQHTGFLQIKENEADLVPLVFRQGPHGFQQRHNTGGVVIGVGRVGRAKQHTNQQYPVNCQGCRAGKAFYTRQKAKQEANRQ